jgi:NTP pyrophosphatase (non-canonical NTP hydrolase)
MDLNQYQIDANRTYPDLGSKELNVSHMIMGMVSEESELINAALNNDKVNLGEEISDIHWYLANYCSIHGIKYELIGELAFYFVPKEKVSFIEALVFAIAELTDKEKKLLAYKKLVSQDERIEMVVHIFHALKSLYELVGLDMNTCLQNNINKLKVRFPEKFDTQLAINRDHAKERVELEKI